MLYNVFVTVGQTQKEEEHMKKALKKGTLMFAAMGIAFSILPMSAMASSVSAEATAETGAVSTVDVETYAGMKGSIYKTSAGHGFGGAWQESGYNGGAMLIYGYNTFLVNEDYSWAYHTSNRHSAIVKNSNGAFMSAKKPAGSDAKIEVTHSGSFIEYQNTWY